MEVSSSLFGMVVQWPLKAKVQLKKSSFFYLTDGGFNILAGDNSEIVFYPTHLNTAGTPSAHHSFWNIVKSIRSNCDKGKILFRAPQHSVITIYSIFSHFLLCSFTGVDIIYGGSGDGNYMWESKRDRTTFLCSSLSHFILLYMAELLRTSNQLKEHSRILYTMTTAWCYCMKILHTCLRRQMLVHATSTQVMLHSWFISSCLLMICWLWTKTTKLPCY